MPADVIVLCYHAVSPTWSAALSVTPAALEHQVGRLVRDGYRGATFTEAALAPRHPRTLAVTFDDAFASVLRLAAPVLDRLGVPGTVFVPTSFPGNGPLRWPGIDHLGSGSDRAELEPLTWRELRELVGSGWEVGSHTVTHPRLTTLDDARLHEELSASRRAIERETALPCRSIAYPYGDADRRVVAAARSAGYEAAAALRPSLESRGPLDVARIGVYHADSDRRFALKVARPVRTLRRSPRALRALALAAGAARAVRR